MAQGIKGTGPNGKDRRAITIKEITSQAREHCPSAIKVLEGIFNNRKTPPAARISAANSLLDRGFGKPAQAIQIKGDPDSPVVFNLLLGAGMATMVDGGAVEVLPGPLTATQDEES